MNKSVSYGTTEFRRNRKLEQKCKVLSSSVESWLWTKQMDKAVVVFVCYEVAMGLGETPQSFQHPLVSHIPVVEVEGRDLLLLEVPTPAIPSHNSPVKSFFL